MADDAKYVMLTPEERQKVLRLMKKAPVMSREKLVQYMNKVRLKVINERKK